MDFIESKMDDVEKNGGSIHSLEHNNDDLPKKAKTWTEFFEKSPMNGMPQIVRSRNFIEKFAWICVVLAGLGATTYMVRECMILDHCSLRYDACKELSYMNQKKILIFHI